jgi:hypothetical protein
MTGDMYEKVSNPKQRTGNENIVAENDTNNEDAILEPIVIIFRLYPLVCICIENRQASILTVIERASMMPKLQRKDNCKPFERIE